LTAVPQVNPAQHLIRWIKHQLKKAQDAADAAIVRFGLISILSFINPTVHPNI
jgi:hypothetical protein